MRSFTAARARRTQCQRAGRPADRCSDWYQSGDIVEGDDRLGEGVNIAARLEQLAEPGGICVSGKVAKEVEKKLAFGFEPMGEQKVKNITEPIPVFKVKLDGMPPRTAARKHEVPKWTWAIVLALVPLAAVSWLVLDPLKPPTPQAAGSFPSIAVLPFQDLSANKSLGYLGDGVAEDIITMLSRHPDLKVVSRTSSFTYKDKPTEVRQIGKELAVGYVLEGSVRKEGDKARIVAQLIDTNSGEHVWADRFDKTGADPWALQDEVTSNIVGSLAGRRAKSVKPITAGPGERTQQRSKSMTIICVDTNSL